MSEEQLTNRFDKYMEELVTDIAYWEEQRAIKIAAGVRESYVWDEDRKILEKKGWLKRAEQILDDIFEQVALIE